MSGGAPAPGSAPLLRVQGLAVEFVGEGTGARRVVDGFGIEVAAGEIVGLMGQPGCGKSTAALAMLGLVRGGGRIAGGTVEFAGVARAAGDEAAMQALRGRGIGFVTQSARAALHPLLDVGTQIANVVMAHEGLPRREALARAAELLRLVGIHEPERRLRAYVHELSTGMAQRVVIAMALSARPKLLIADEPTSGLDVTIQAQVLDGLWEAARRTGSAVLLVTQNLGIVANYCDRVAIMHEGRVVEDRRVPEFFRAPEHDYSRRILALQRAGEEVEGDAAMRAARASDVADAAPLLRVTGLRKTFGAPRAKHRVVAIDGVDLELRRGECLGLVGESGSGKTTVGRCVLRLEQPDAGEIGFDGQALHALDATALRRLRARMQIIFQDPLESMDPRWTVEEVVREPLDHATTLAEDEKARRIAALLEATGVPRDRSGARPRELSAGLQQRVGIARAMATQPDFVVLDEPTSALTPETTVEVLRLLRRLQLEHQPGFLYISHDLTTVRFLCHRVAVLYLGQVVETGTKEQVFGAPAHPYTQALIDAHLFPDLDHRRVDRPKAAALAGEIPGAAERGAGCYLVGRCPLEQPRCRTEPQALRTLADGRQVRCWRVSPSPG